MRARPALDRRRGRHTGQASERLNGHNLDRQGISRSNRRATKGGPPLSDRPVDGRGAACDGTDLRRARPSLRHSRPAGRIALRRHGTLPRRLVASHRRRYLRWNHDSPIRDSPREALDRVQSCVVARGATNRWPLRRRLVHWNHRLRLRGERTRMRLILAHMP